MKNILVILLIFSSVCLFSQQILTANDARKLSNKAAPTVLDIMQQISYACNQRDANDVGKRSFTYTDKITPEIETFLRDSLGYLIVIGEERKNNIISW